eukprot:jgi/Ulvmu1/5535/UM023_0071.1
MKPVIVRQGSKTQVRYGVFLHDDWIGKPFGSKVYSKSGSWLYLLAPTCELWTGSLSHRTQILYTSDCAQICSGLDLRSGSVVLESGTGSGSLTHSLARAVAPTGAVHTFEFHKQRCEEATAEFEQNGLADIVQANHRDIEAHGFPERCHGIADGIILDLPAPWKVVESAKACLKMNGKFCGFSPCIEQVQRTADALREAEFCDVRCIECILRYHDVRTENYALPTADATAPADPAGEPAADTATAADGKRTAAEAGLEAADGATAGGAGAEGSAGGGKRKGIGGGKRDAGQGRVKERRLGRHCALYVPWMSEQASVRRTVTLPRHMARGHTGYLLFARKPVTVEGQRDEEGEEGGEDGGEAAEGKERGEDAGVGAEGGVGGAGAEAGAAAGAGDGAAGNGAMDAEDTVGGRGRDAGV